MNLGIITSYIVAGVLLLGIAMMNIRVQNSSAELTLATITKEHLVNITDMINDDFPNMGYDVIRSTRDNDDVDNMILAEGRVRKISFYRNLSNDPTRTPDLITWELIDETPSTSRNPNHRKLVRSVQYESTGTPEETEINVGVTRFQLRYYTTVGADLSNNVSAPGQVKNNLDQVRQIHVILELQSNEPIYARATGDGRFVRSVWEKRFTPPNLQIN
jgi:hypothetical protein